MGGRSCYDFGQGEKAFHAVLNEHAYHGPKKTGSTDISVPKIDVFELYNNCLLSSICFSQLPPEYFELLINMHTFKIAFYKKKTK